MISEQFEGRRMRRFRRNANRSPWSDPSEARDLVDLAARMGIPPEDAARQVAQLIDDANNGERTNLDRNADLDRKPAAWPTVAPRS
jgi:hypothetical protein